jgi:hypothetical protein
MKDESALEKWIGAAAFLAVLAASVAWLVVPGGDAATLPDEIGSSAYAWLALPVLFAGLPMVAPSSRHPATVISAWLLLAYCTVTGWSIGILYWPAFCLMVAAAYVGAHARRAAASA